MNVNFARLITVALSFSSLFLIPGESHEVEFKNNDSNDKIIKVDNILCADDNLLVKDFEKSFDHKNRALIDRVNEKDNLIDLLGIGPSRYPENRMVQESKKLWDTFECHLSEFSEKNKIPYLSHNLFICEF